MKKSKRYEEAGKMREGKTTFREIGISMGISACRASQLVDKFKEIKNKKPHWGDGLSVRVQNCLNNAGVENRDDAAALFAALNAKERRTPRNYGRKSHLELSIWLKLQNKS